MSEELAAVNEAAIVEWLKMQRQFDLADELRPMFIVAFKAGCLFGHTLGMNAARDIVAIVNKSTNLNPEK